MKSIYFQRKLLSSPTPMDIAPNYRRLCVRCVGTEYQEVRSYTR